MWKLVDCGTYLWFVKPKTKYFHCVYGITGEYKKIKRNRRVVPGLYATGRSKFYLACLESWPLDNAPCQLDIRTKKFYIKNWKSKEKTKLMKEIIKQLRAI